MLSYPHDFLKTLACQAIAREFWGENRNSAKSPHSAHVAFPSPPASAAPPLRFSLPFRTSDLACFSVATSPPPSKATVPPAPLAHSIFHQEASIRDGRHMRQMRDDAT